MSLQIWLPLNGNLNNNGIGQVTISSGSYNQKAGKFGYGHNTQTSISFNCPSMNDKQEYSIAFWIKADSSSTITSDWNRCFIAYDKNSSGTTGSGLRFESTYSHSPRACSTHNNNAYYLYTGSRVLAQNKDTWYHVCVTSNGSTFCSYTDGQLIGTDSAVAGYLTGYFTIGSGNYAGCINDLRIYDHVLSAKEVEEISKGLVIHYKLNNLISGNLIEYDCSGYKYNGTYNVTPTTINKAVGRFEKAIHFTKAATCLIMPSLSYITSGTVSLWVNIEALGTNGWLPLTGQSASYYILATSGGTGSFYNGGVSGTITYYLDGNAVSAPTNLTTGWHHVAITGVNLSSWTSAVLNAYGGVSGTGWNSTVNYSDFRIYATALSASQIKELYNTSVSIDKGQNIFERELIESDDYLEVDITKIGIIKAKEINETTQSGIYKTGKITANAFYEY